MHILIANFHSIQNKGDLGIVLGLIDGLKAVYPTATFAVLGKDIQERAWWEARGMSFSLPLLRYGPKEKIAHPSWFTSKGWAARFFLAYASSLLFARSKKGLRWFYRHQPEALRTLDAYQKADVVISKGGSFFREPEYLVNILPIGILGHLHQLLLAERFQKKIIVSAQSFGPINNPFSRWAVGRAFRRFALVTARDADSKHFLETRLNVKENARCVGDSAFLMKAGPENEPVLRPLKQEIEQGKKNGLTYVGITVRAWSNPEQFMAYKKAFASLVERYGKTHRFFFFPQVIGPSRGEDDRLISQQVIDELPFEVRSSVHFIQDDFEPAQLITLYGWMDCFVATRLHSSIFALLAGTPVMAIGYEPKTIGVFRDLGIERFVLDIRSLHHKEMQTLFEELKQTPHATFAYARDKAITFAQTNIGAIQRALSD